MVAEISHPISQDEFTPQYEVVPTAFFLRFKKD